MINSLVPEKLKRKCSLLVLFTCTFNYAPTKCRRSSVQFYANHNSLNSKQFFYAFLNFRCLTRYGASGGLFI